MPGKYRCALLLGGSTVYRHGLQQHADADVHSSNGRRRDRDNLAVCGVATLYGELAAILLRWTGGCANNLCGRDASD